MAATVRDIKAADFIQKFSEHLKKTGKVPVPQWVDTVKTSTANELAPYDENWFYVRMAAIARKIYLNKNSGVGQLAKAFGSNERRGAKPNRFLGASRSPIRKALQALEKLKYVEKGAEGGSRKMTTQGQKAMDTIAKSVKFAK